MKKSNRTQSAPVAPSTIGRLTDGEIRLLPRKAGHAAMERLALAEAALADCREGTRSRLLAEASVESARKALHGLLQEAKRRLSEQEAARLRRERVASEKGWKEATSFASKLAGIRLS